MPRQRLYTVALLPEQRQRLLDLIDDESTSMQIGRRCRLLLALDQTQKDYLTYEEAAQKFEMNITSVALIAKQLYNEGFEAVIHKKRNINSDKARQKLIPEAESVMLSVVYGPKPEGKPHWSVRLLTEEVNKKLDVPVSKDTINRALLRNNIKLKEI